MKTTKILSKRKWRRHLKNRKYMDMFDIPVEIAMNVNARNMTKRLIEIILSTGIKLKGVATVSSGTEIYIPTHLRHYFENAKWFDCEIVNNTLYEKSTLDIY